MKVSVLTALAALLSAPNAALVNAQSCPTVCGRGWGDPHMVTYDQLKYDCQGQGEFIVTESKDSDLMVQGRFVIGGGHSLQNSGYPVTVSRGYVFTYDNVPTIQLTVPDHDPSCPISYTVDGVAHDIPTQGTTSPNVFYSASGSTRIFRFPRAGADDLRIEVSVKYSSKNGCQLAIQVCLPCDMQSEELVGLLGPGPDGDKSNDWMTNAPTPAPVAVPTEKKDLLFGPAYAYCVPNWCIYDEANSIFTYTDKTFDDYHICTDPADFDDGGLSEILFAPPNPDAVAGKCYNGHFYQYEPTRRQYVQARDEAFSRTKFGMQGYLATITDFDENQWLRSALTQEKAWIGLNDIDNEGDYIWVHGDEVYDVNHAFWKPGEPNNNGQEDCAEINSGLFDGGKMGWNDKECDAYRAYIIEYDSCGPTEDEINDLKDKIPGNPEDDDFCWECLIDGIEGDEEDVDITQEILNELEDIIRFAPPPELEVGENGPQPTAQPSEAPDADVPVVCECVDDFISEASSDYAISNQALDFGGLSVTVHSRRVKLSGATYTDSVVVKVGDAIFEASGSGYFLDGAAVTVPAVIAGYPISESVEGSKTTVTINFGSGSLGIKLRTGPTLTMASITTL